MEDSKLVWKERKRTWFGAPWTFTVYGLSEDRFFLKTGVFSIKEDEVRLYHIKDISLRKGFMQRIFGLGTIVVNSSDSSLKNFSIVNVKHPDSVKEQLSQYVEEERQKKRVSSREILSETMEDEEDEEDADEGDN